MRKYGLKALALATAMSMVLSSPLQVFAKRRANTAGSWKQSGENWSFLDEKGQNVLGWIYENGSWYYVDGNTSQRLALPCGRQSVLLQQQARRQLRQDADRLELD